MIHIHAQSIPHVEHRYPTAGDFFVDANGVQQFRVSEMSDYRFEALVFLHEFVESVLCKHHNIAEADITAFDIMFEEERARGMHKNEVEPGFDPRAPYRAEHTAAMGLEMTFAALLDVCWNKFENELEALP